MAATRSSRNPITPHVATKEEFLPLIDRALSAPASECHLSLGSAAVSFEQAIIVFNKLRRYRVWDEITLGDAACVCREWCGVAFALRALRPASARDISVMLRLNNAPELPLAADSAPATVPYPNAPVPTAIGSGLLAALESEYRDGVGLAVGHYFDEIQMNPSMQYILEDCFEKSVRRVARGSWQQTPIAAIKERWSNELAARLSPEQRARFLAACHEGEDAVYTFLETLDRGGVMPNSELQTLYVSYFLLLEEKVDSVADSVAELWRWLEQRPSKDGEYTLYLQGDPDQPVRLYCHNVLSARPTEFITLHSLHNRSVMPPGGAATGSTLMTTFRKLRFCPHTMMVKTDNYTFSITDGGPVTQQYWNGKRQIKLNRLPFATARDAQGRGEAVAHQLGLIPGLAEVDLQGTSFGVRVQPEPHGSPLAFAALGRSPFGSALCRHMPGGSKGVHQEVCLRGGGLTGRCSPALDVTRDEQAQGADYNNEGLSGGWVLPLERCVAPMAAGTEPAISPVDMAYPYQAELVQSHNGMLYYVY